jgi:hypothetical protein
MVVHAYNLSYLGDGNRRIMVWGQLRQKLERPYFKTKLGMVGHTCSSSYSGVENRKTGVQGQPGQNSETLFDKLKIKELGGWLK